ncbi:MAG: S8 family serine peptidase, partial [Atopobiaceae bacterium]|nr:S8 family serine peptidase [Atopobiaceae bacterium]
VAGIISAVSDNKLGVSGVSYNARLMPIKVTDGNGNASTADIAKAFDYVIRHASTYNVRVINLSMCMEGSLQIDADLLARIDQAYAKGIVTVCAAGNGAGEPFDCFPGDYDKAVSVINLRQSGNTVVRNSESNYNAAGTYGKDISAPGTSIMSTIPTTQGEYDRMSGTSMAAPHVAGILALEFAANPKLSAQQAIDVLHATTVDLGNTGWDREYGYGEANAFGAVYGAIHGMDAAQLKFIKQQQAREMAAKEARAIASLQYRSCAQYDSFGSWKSKGATSGATKSGMALEALRLELNGSPYAGGVQYCSCMGDDGWQSWKANGETSGVLGEGKQVEAFKARLTGEMSKRYDIWYRVYVRKFGWSGWTKNGSSAGTVGYGYRIEAMQAKLAARGSEAPGSTANALRFTVKYCSCKKDAGWQSWHKNGSTSGSKKASAGIKALRVRLVGAPYSGSIRYRVRMKGTGWQGWRKNGVTAGSKKAFKRLGAIRIKLTDTLASHYHVYYRVYVKGYGWLGWAKNGAPAGTAGYAHPIKGVQIRIVERGSKAPGSTQGAYRTK